MYRRRWWWWWFICYFTFFRTRFCVLLFYHSFLQKLFFFFSIIYFFSTTTSLTGRYFIFIAYFYVNRLLPFVVFTGTTCLTFYLFKCVLMRIIYISSHGIQTSPFLTLADSHKFFISIFVHRASYP